MQLLCALPKWAAALIDGEPIYAMPYDISEQGAVTDGYCVATKAALFAVADGKLQRRYALEQVDDIATEQLIGSGSLNITLAGERQLVCVFTHQYLAPYAELAGALQYTLRTGDVIEKIDHADGVQLCPKCGSPLPPGSQQCLHCMKKGKTLMRLLQFCGPYRKTIFAAAFFSLMCEVFYIILPYLQQIVIDDFITPKREDWPVFWLIVLANVVVCLLLWGCDFLGGRCAVRAGAGVAKDLRSRVFGKIQSLSMTALARRTTGELINRVAGDTQKLQNFIIDYGKDGLVYTCSSIILVVLLFAANWLLALLVLIPIPIVFVVVQRLQRQLHKRYHKVWPKWDESNAVLHDVLSGINVIKTFGTEARETKRYADASLEYNTRMMRADVFWFEVIPFITFFITIGEFFVLLFGGMMVLEGSLTLGKLVQFTVYVGYLYVPMRWWVRLPKMIADATISAGKIFDVLDEKVDMAEHAGDQAPAIRGEVEFRDVSFGYKIYNRVLKHVSFKVQPGEMIGIVGHSGAGKTTLINLLMRLYDPGSGAILVDGVDLRDMDPSAYRNRVGVVLQENFLFAGTIYDNIAFSKPDATMMEVVAAAKVGGVHEFITKLPDGYNTRVGDKGYTLSGGERQRIAIARAVLHNPAFLILDEATASLDTETEKQIQEAIARVSHGRTTFAIAHRLSTLHNADRILVIDKGELVEVGSHLELMKKKGVYHDLVMAQRQTAKIKQ